MQPSLITRLAGLLIVLCCLQAHPAPDIEYAHGTSYLEPLKYPPDFQHFEWANPDAPKGGLLRAPETVSYTHLTLPTICSV